MNIQKVKYKDREILFINALDSVAIRSIDICRILSISEQERDAIECLKRPCCTWLCAAQVAVGRDDDLMFFIKSTFQQYEPTLLDLAGLNDEWEMN